MAVSKLDKLLKKRQYLKHRLLKKKPLKRRVISPYQPGLLKIHNIPFGFFEDELKAYFNQFGKVLAVFVPRHKKTSNVKNFAFVKFAHLEVAKIAAKSMNNYLMYDQVLKCRVSASTRQIDKLIAQKDTLKISTRTKHKMVMNQDRPEDKDDELIRRKICKIRKDESKLKELGVKFKCILLTDAGEL